MLVKSYGKLTLGLKVFQTKLECIDFLKVKKEANRFDSIFVICKEIYDEVYFEDAEDFSVKYLDFKGQELQFKPCYLTIAKVYLERKFSVQIKGRITVIKRTFENNGFETQESNIAAFVRHYASFFELSLSFDELAKHLGFCVPFFISNFLIARVKNYGNEVSPIFNLNLPTFNFHFMNDVQSPWVFDKTSVIKLFNTSSAPKLKNYYIDELVQNLIGQSSTRNQNPHNDIQNDYQGYVFQLYPQMYARYLQLKTPNNQVFVNGLGDVLVSFDGFK